MDCKRVIRLLYHFWGIKRSVLSMALSKHDLKGLHKVSHRYGYAACQPLHPLILIAARQCSAVPVKPLESNTLIFLCSTLVLHEIYTKLYNFMLQMFDEQSNMIYITTICLQSYKKSVRLRFFTLQPFKKHNPSFGSKRIEPTATWLASKEPITLHHFWSFKQIKVGIKKPE